MEGVRRRFGRTVALDGAWLTLHKGEVHAVLGENGAGKTTLLGVLAGLVAPDAGTVAVGGRVVRVKSPQGAWALGVGMVHQHFSLVPCFTVLENLALGGGGLGRGLERLRRDAPPLAHRVGLQASLDAAVEGLGVGERQRVEILKVLLRRPSVLILDEPTAVLAPAEVRGLLGLLRDLAAAGDTVVLVAHKLDEVLAVADRVTVLREGRTVLEAARRDVNAAALVRAMVGPAGDALATEVVAAAAPPAPGGDAPLDRPLVVALRGVSLRGASGRVALQDVELDVRRGEVVGVAGVEGNGQRELARILVGLLVPTSGEVERSGAAAFIPQDRNREGLIGDFTLAENMALALHRQPAYRWGPFLRWARLTARSAELLRAFSVRPAAPDALARTLSGGNQQRVVVAREVGAAPALLVAENPTRGLDVAAAAFVHRQLRELHHAGVVLISTDLDEVLRLADRVLVMVRGRLVPVPEPERTREGVGRRMLTGGSAGGARDP